MKKRVLIDFDGVLHSYTSGWKGADIIHDEPLPGSIKWLMDMMDQFDVSIFSVRCNAEEGIIAMRIWLAAWGLPQGYLDELHFEPGKPASHLIIDDRAYTFMGCFPDPTSVERFQPWYKGAK